MCISRESLCACISLLKILKSLKRINFDDFPILEITTVFRAKLFKSQKHLVIGFSCFWEIEFWKLVNGILNQKHRAKFVKQKTKGFGNFLRCVLKHCLYSIVVNWQTFRPFLHDLSYLACVLTSIVLSPFPQILIGVKIGN